MPTPGNSINEQGASGLVNFNGTATFASTPAMTYNVLTGASSNTVNNVAPSATSGVPLISQGSVSQPVFGTAVVAGGGTGDTSFTAYSVITGGTTSTGALQNVSGVGTSGQVLTSNGNSTLPTWQNNTPFPPSPNVDVSLVDDFIGTNTLTTTPGSTAQAVTSSLSWASLRFIQTPALETGHPGILTNQAATGNFIEFYLSYNSTVAVPYPSNLPFLLGGGVLTLNFVIKINNLSTALNNYTFNIGITDFSTIGAVNNGCYFSYTNGTNSGNWVLNCVSSAVATTTNTSTAATTGWHNFQISINAAASSVNFTLDGALLGTITTNIPTANPVTPGINIGGGGAVANTFYIDLFYLSQVLTNAR